MRNLYETKTWTDKQGVTHRLKDMDLSYCENVLGFLERNAQKLLWGEYLTAESYVMSHDGGDMAHESLESAAWALQRQYMESDWDIWLAELPTVIALKKAIKKKRKKIEKLAKKEKEIWDASAQQH